MKTRVLGLIFLGILANFSTVSVGFCDSTPDGVDPPTAIPTPMPTSPPMVAPTWAPQTAGSVPEALKSKKPSRWMSLTALGVGVPLSRNIQTAYSSGFNADLGSGYKVSDNFSIWLDIDLDLFGSKNDSLTQSNNFTLIEAALWARCRILDGDFSPYVFAGPGIAYNEYRSDQGPIVNYQYQYSYVPVNSYEFDFLAEGGIGIEMRLAPGLSGFLQGRLTYDFTSMPFAAYGSTDSPLTVMPFELGIIFGI